MKSKRVGVAKVAALFCVPLVVLAGVPAAQQYAQRRQALSATDQLFEKLGGSVEAPQASVEELVGAGADVKRMTRNGYRPLHWAAVRDSPSEARLFLDHGADINAGDGWGQTALATAADRGSVEVVRLLLKRGAKVNASAPSFEGVTYTALYPQQPDGCRSERGSNRTADRRLVS